jgi:hypothetical protein
MHYLQHFANYDGPIHDEDSGTLYEPWTNGYAVGFKATRQSDGQVEYIYLNPSGGSDDTVATVFIYQGKGDVVIDHLPCYLTLFGSEPADTSRYEGATGETWKREGVQA